MTLTPTGIVKRRSTLRALGLFRGSVRAMALLPAWPVIRSAIPVQREELGFFLIGRRDEFPRVD